MNSNNFYKYSCTKAVDRLLKRIIVCLLFVIGSFNASAQDNNYKILFTDAEYYFLFQDYKEALPIYLKLYEQNRSNANLNYRIGMCYLNIPGLKNKSIPYLEFAVKRINQKYQEGSYKELGAPSISIFYLGEAYMVNNMLDKAIESFNQFRDQLDIKDVYNLDFVDQEIKACELAKKMMNDPIKVKFERSDALNITGKECNYPLISGDRQSMVFTAKEKFYDGIYYCRFADGKWGSSINITLDLNIEGEVYATSLNYDGTQMIIFKNEKIDGNLYLSILENGKWGKAIKMHKNINSKEWETFGSFSPDGKTIYFTSNRKGGIGGLDIYSSTLQPNGEWSLPASLGDIINSSYNEESPVLTLDGKTLYFASQGHNSMGGFDIFYSQKLDNNTWSVPVNMGYPINTTDNDVFYSPVDENNALVSRISEERLGIRENFSLQIIKQAATPEIIVKGKMLVADNREIVSDLFSIKVMESKTGVAISTLKPKAATGEFSFAIKPGNYNVEIKGNGYETQSRNLHVPDNYSFKEIPLEVNLKPEGIASGEFVTIKSIKFDFDSYSLNREALFEIEKIYQLMAKNSSLYIEVTGHTDSKGSVAYNQKLSLKRARSVIDYLVSKSINQDRFIAKGAGAQDNVALNTNPDGTDNPEGRSLNRRVCMRVIKSDKNIQISENVEVPEQLMVQGQNFTILLTPKEERVQNQDLVNIQKATEQKPQITEIGAVKFVTIGSFASKSAAINLLNKCIDNGFPNASIIGENDLNQLIKEEKSKIIIQSKTYTIQLTTLKNPVEVSSFKGLKVTEIKGSDGYYRYIYGEYKNQTDAKVALNKVIELGFPDAFIVGMENLKK
ncbi:MAG: OmpA family protein [Tenuifilaceae bacterium]